jgi:hypothetical protein
MTPKSASVGVEPSAEGLTADFVRALPGGKLDDSAYEQIEDALDRAEAPCQAPDGKWLTLAERVAALRAHYLETVRLLRADYAAPIDMVLFCPACGLQHIDEPEDVHWRDPSRDAAGTVGARWTNPPHRSHLCHGCGCIWRPADVPTNGVAAVKTRGKADTIPTSSEPADARNASHQLSATDEHK